MTTDLVAFKEIAESDAPHSAKSLVKRLVDRVTHGGASRAVAAGEAKLRGDKSGAAVAMVRSGLESTATAAGLAWVDVHMGLDIGKVPVDGAVGGAAALGSVALGGSEASTDLRNIANAAISVFAFRKTHQFFAEKRIAAPKGTAKIHGDDDPVVAQARSFTEE